MTVKKDHSIGSGTGAAAGAVTGAAIGTVGGPLGALAGAAIGGIAGAKAGDEVAEMVNPTEYTAQFEKTFQDKPYYNSSRTWQDYSPAYQYGYNTYGTYRGRKFDDVETELERDWDNVKADSRLAWNEARAAVRDGWHSIERTLPGDFDRDGR